MGGKRKDGKKGGKRQKRTGEEASARLQFANQGAAGEAVIKITAGAHE